MMKVLRANVETGQISIEDAPESWQPYGGRALVARFLLDEVPPDCDPLGPFNKLIWAPGLLVGHMLSSVDRISLGAKSPLTGGAKESNGGGSTGMRMGWRRLYVGEEGARFEEAGDLVGLNLKETGQRLMERYDDRIGVSAIGAAGERMYQSAGIAHMDKDRNLTRLSARGGLGAVMGSKHLKAIVFDRPRSNQPEIVDKELFREASKRHIQALQTHPQTSEVYTFFGTAAMVSMCNSLGGLPTRNFSQGSFEQAEAISGETIRLLNESRG